MTATITIAAALCEPRAYTFAVDAVTVVETHMSWVFLAGDYAFKVKKPIHFDFVDFSTLSDREHFCRRELLLNRRFAPDLYLDVVPVVDAPGGLMVGAVAGDVVDWAVQMRRFPTHQQCDVMLADGRLSTADLFQFGVSLAGVHEGLPTTDGVPIGSAIADNFATLMRVDMHPDLKASVELVREQSERALATGDKALRARAESGCVRQCHGDLHLANLVKLDDRIVAFDCLEFDEALSAIDMWADVAFLYMDLAVRGRTDLAYAFVDGYLDTGGDYGGACQLPLFAGYRAMVRAKVHMLRYLQTQEAASMAEVERYVRWAAALGEREYGSILLTHGLSGSGKSFWSGQIVSALGCVRLRSDILRKKRAGLSSRARSDSELSDGIYSAEQSEATYEELAHLAVVLAQAGESVIIDAASLQEAQRRIVFEQTSNSGIDCRLVSFTAPPEVLRERILDRARIGDDPSEADVEVLDWQLAHADALRADENAVVFNTESGDLEALLVLLR